MTGTTRIYDVIVRVEIPPDETAPALDDYRAWGARASNTLEVDEVYDVREVQAR